eukprot:TRINITY_DN5723_c1_g1_i1.p1 TRINITY_DN5723_c1_g1~~TRINITY_DN5723_c1_g1_i1.p1  ORF type:complete len:178 (-),score=1.15 TRINITY_DN5723_c1_g1_i1:166-699(-)
MLSCKTMLHFRLFFARLRIHPLHLATDDAHFCLILQSSLRPGKVPSIRRICSLIASPQSTVEWRERPSVVRMLSCKTMLHFRLFFARLRIHPLHLATDDAHFCLILQSSLRPGKVPSIRRICSLIASRQSTVERRERLSVVWMLSYKTMLHLSLFFARLRIRPLHLATDDAHFCLVF